jgi:hypothetical protein
VRQACAILTRAAAEYCLSRHKVIGLCSCEPLPEHLDDYVLGLYCSSVTPREVLGSNLVGWYAVAKSDASVFEWDINEEFPKPLEMRPGQPFGCQ